MGRIRRTAALLLALILLCAGTALAAAPKVTATPDPNPKPTLPADVTPYDPEHPEDLLAEQLYSWSAILIEAETGQVIFEKNPDDIRYPASCTKIMTALLTLIMCDEWELDNTVVCSEEAVAVNWQEEDVTTLNLQAGEEISLRDLLNAMLIYSANDAANVVAEAVGGTIENFVALMNEAAWRYGCTNTHFANPHGLHDDTHYTTPRDLATIAREAWKFDLFREIVGTESYVVPRTNMHRARTLKTTNQLFSPGTETKANRYYFPDIRGIKTGFTGKAQYCFVGAAERDGVTLISVIMYAGDNSRWADTIKLMNYGFSQYMSVTPAELYAMNPITIETSGYALNDADMGRLSLSVVPADRKTAQNTHIIATKDEVAAMAKNIRQIMLFQYTRDFAAPVEAGEVMGTMTYFPENGDAVVYNLTANRAVRRRENAPKTLEQIVAETEADPNPFPPWSVETVLLALLPAAVAAGLIALVIAIHRRRRHRRGRTPRVTHRYLR